MKRKPQPMPCPACKRMHPVGEHKRQLGAMYGKPGKIIYSPDDVECPCGMRLRHTVPIFFISPHGWCWRIIADPYDGGADNA